MAPPAPAAAGPAEPRARLRRRHAMQAHAPVQRAAASQAAQASACAPGCTYARLRTTACSGGAPESSSGGHPGLTRAHTRLFGQRCRWRTLAQSCAGPQEPRHRSQRSGRRCAGTRAAGQDSGDQRCGVRQVSRVEAEGVPWPLRGRRGQGTSRKGGAAQAQPSPGLPFASVCCLSVLLLMLRVAHIRH